MRKTVLAALAAAGALLPAMAQAGPDVRVHKPGHEAGTSWQHGRQTHYESRSDANHDARRGGYNRHPDYRVIRRGGMLPRAWHDPRYGISDYGMYGFDRPTNGSRWVRYYDDALLVDRYGRVRDGRYGMDFDRYGDAWDYDERGVAYHGDFADERDYARSDRFDRGDGGDLDYDRDYAYDHRYGGEGCRDTRMGCGGGYGGYGSAYGYGGGGYTITETTVTTAPSTVHYVEEAVAVYRPKHYKHKRVYRGHKRAKSAARCACK